MSTNATAVNLTPVFKDGASTYSPPKAYTSRVQLQLGPAPASATVIVPLAADGERAPAVAGIDAAPTQKIKLGTPCMIQCAVGETVSTPFAGFVTDVLHKLGPDEDYLVVTLKDHRWLLTGRKFEGSYYSPGDGTVTYCEARPAVFNEDGQPNMTLTDEGGVCVFCEPNLGLSPGEDPPATPVKGKASYWSPDWAFLYAWYCMCATSGAPATAKTAFPHLKQKPSTLTWDFELGADLETDPDGQSTVGKAKEVSIDGMKVGAALHEICQMAGPYTIDVDADQENDWTGVLAIKRTQYNGAGENVIDVVRRIAGGQSVCDDQTFIDGEFGENCEETFTSCVIVGDPVVVETRVTLQATWTSDRFSAWRSKLVAGLAAGKAPADSFADANASEPGVCRDFRLDPTHDFITGTTEEGKPLAVRLRRPLAHLVTSYLQGSGATYAEMLSAPLQMQFEVSDDSGSTWTLLDESAAAVLPDGTIRLTSARQAGLTFGYLTASLESKLRDPSALLANQVRATIAIPCEHRLLCARRLETDADTNLTLFGGTNVDTDRMYDGTEMQFCAVTHKGYHREIRKASYPTPQAIGGTSQTDTLRDDADYLAAHVERKMADYGRLKKRGHFSYLGINPLWRPGYQIENLLNRAADDSDTSYPVKAVCSAVIFDCGAEVNLTHLVIGG